MSKIDGIDCSLWQGEQVGLDIVYTNPITRTNVGESITYYYNGLPPNFKIYAGTLFGVNIYVESLEEFSKLLRYMEGYFPNDYVSPVG